MLDRIRTQFTQVEVDEDLFNYVLEYNQQKTNISHPIFQENLLYLCKNIEN